MRVNVGNIKWNIWGVNVGNTKWNISGIVEYNSPASSLHMLEHEYF